LLRFHHRKPLEIIVVYFFFERSIFLVVHDVNEPVTFILKALVFGDLGGSFVSKCLGSHSFKLLLSFRGVCFHKKLSFVKQRFLISEVK
jgi:hypothetical protein